MAEASSSDSPCGIACHGRTAIAGRARVDHAAPPDRDTPVASNILPLGEQRKNLLAQNGYEGIRAKFGRGRNRKAMSRRHRIMFSGPASCRHGPRRCRRRLADSCSRPPVSPADNHTPWILWRGISNIRGQATARHTNCAVAFLSRAEQHQDRCIVAIGPARALTLSYK